MTESEYSTMLQESEKFLNYLLESEDAKDIHKEDHQMIKNCFMQGWVRAMDLYPVNSNYESTNQNESD